MEENPYKQNFKEKDHHCPYCFNFDAGIAVGMAFFAGLFSGICLKILADFYLW